MTIFKVDDVAVISVEITDTAGTLVDPSSITLFIKTPTGLTHTYITDDITKDAVGKYHFNLTLIYAGSYGYRWETTGANQGIVEGGIYVYPQQVV